MAAPRILVFREYTSDDSFTKFVISRNDENEFQVALTFARDYEGDHSTHGRFIPYWDTATVTPAVIANFRETFPSAKVLVSIGNDKRHFPFQITDEQPVAAWINNATESLKQIIQEYHLDGIDVYYEDIVVSNPAIFVHCIGELIQTLKANNVITRASISPNYATIDQFYWPLYQDFEDHIDNIVFQCFISSVENVTPTPTPIATAIMLLWEKINRYPSKKLLLGYTGIREDWPWALFPPPLFFVICYICLSWGLINGASLKVTRCPITYFPPQWILDLLSFFSNPGPFALPPRNN